MEKLDIIKIHKQTEDIYLELKEKYSNNEEMAEMRQYFKKILELLNKITISEIWNQNENDEKV